jgi:hypothetical protein
MLLVTLKFEEFIVVIGFANMMFRIMIYVICDEDHYQRGALAGATNLLLL